MLDKLIQAIIKKNGKCSSAEINSCSVRVNDSPLLSDCVIGHRLVSDLELGLQDHRADILALLNDSARQPQYAESGSRHVSASWLFNHLAELDAAIVDTAKKVKDTSASPSTVDSDSSNHPSAAPSAS